MHFYKETDVINRSVVLLLVLKATLVYTALRCFTLVNVCHITTFPDIEYIKWTTGGG